MTRSTEYYKLLALEQARVGRFQGDFPKINCHDLFTSICFHTRLDTLSVNSRIYPGQFLFTGLQLSRILQ